MHERDWTRPGDDRILTYLAENGPETSQLLAGRLGMHLKCLDGRLEEFLARGVVDRVDDRRYGITDRGRRLLEDDGQRPPESEGEGDAASAD